MYYISPGPVFREECDGAYHIWKIGVLYIVGTRFSRRMRWRLLYLGYANHFLEKGWIGGCIIHRSDPFFEENAMVQIFASFISFFWCLAKCFHPSLGIFRDVDRYKTFWSTSGLGVCERQKNAIVRVHPFPKARFYASLWEWKWKTTAPRIPAWSPTVVLTRRHFG
jgi:hypothetical protein